MFASTRFLLLVLSSMALAACGGGGGGGADAGAGAGADSGSATTTASGPPVDPGVTLASVELAKYEGVWRQDCVDHMKRTATLVATGARVFTVTPQEQLFAYADCTGAVVATGSFGTFQETVQYQEIQPNASITLSNGEVITASVDLGTSVQSVATFVYTGSGVTNTIDGPTTTLTHVVYADGSANILRAKANGQTTSGGLLLFNGELLAVVPLAGSTTAFVVNQRYIR